jgi:Fe2+ transport system protein B
VTKENIPYATITAYVTDEARRDIPIMHLVTTLNPVRIELPIAHELGTKIQGPEYVFSTYNISVDIFGYFTNIIYNNRLFPGVTTDFVIEMVPITVPQPVPIIEERLDIPPHPRDIVP